MKPTNKLSSTSAERLTAHTARDRLDILEQMKVDDTAPSAALLLAATGARGARGAGRHGAV